jgi:hypothetical protein
MNRLVLILLLIIFLFACNEKSSPKKQEIAASGFAQSESKKREREIADNTTEDMDEAPSAPKEESTSPQKPTSSNEIGKPLNPISDASTRRLLEYRINLTFKVDNIHVSREKLIQIVKTDSILKTANTNISGDTEYVSVEIYTPIDKMYETMLSLGQVGILTGETVQTEDWTEYSEEQKIKTERELARSSRRSKAAGSGKAENWTWKDREELLERSEDNLDAAKMETWKIQDKVKWAKLNIVLQGQEAGYRIHVPRFRNAFISSINFLLQISYSILWALPFLLMAGIVYFIYRWYKNRSY